MRIKTNILLRVRFVVFLSISLGFLVAYRLFHIQYAEGDTWRARSVRLHEKFQELPPKRGNIWTDKGHLLATSLTFYRLAMDPSLPPLGILEQHVADFSVRLSSHFGGSAEAYERRILSAREKGKRYLLLSKILLSPTDKKRLSAWPFLSLASSVNGVLFEPINRRFSPFSPLAARTIGSVNWQGNGVVGLEYSFNELLSGQGGQVLTRRSAAGWTPVYNGSEVFPEDGKDLVVTLDMEMQDIVQSELLKGVISAKAHHGSVILMEVATGAIKAIANLSRSKSKGQYRETYNYAVGRAGCVEPGSTFKLVTMLSLLEHSNALLTDRVDTGDGRYQIRSEVMRDDKKGGFGLLTVQDVFEQSSNIGMAKLAMQHFGGRSHLFTDYIHSLKLREAFHFEIKGVGVPYLKRSDDPTWSGTSLPWMAHGYELTVTPLHLLLVYNAVANGGRMMSPYLVSSEREGDETVRSYTPRVLVPSIASAENIKRVQTLLEGVVERGTAQRIKGTSYGIAGKTGTAKKHKNGRYVDEYYASFVGYFPKDRPKYSCIVVMDGPQSGRIYGGDVAAPVFRNIAERICVLDPAINPIFSFTPGTVRGLPRLPVGYIPAVRAWLNEVGLPYEAGFEAAWGMGYADGDTVRWRARSFTDKKIPNVQGMRLRDALFVLENAQLRVAKKGYGRVAKQHPRPGGRYKRGQTIWLALSE